MSQAPVLNTILLPTPADAATIGGLDDGDWIFIQGPGPQRGYYTFIPGLVPPGAIVAPGGWLMPFAGGGGGSSPFSSIVYRPGGVSGANVYATWAEVMTAFNALAGFVHIGIDDSLVSPAVINADSDLQSRAVFVPAKQQSPLSPPPTFTVADGNQITNPASLDGFVRLLTNSTIVRPVAFSAGSSHLFEMDNGARFENVGAVPAVQIAGADQLVMTVFGGAYVATGASSVLDLAGTATLRLYAFDGSTFASPNIVTGIAGTTLLFAHDASVLPLSFAPPFGGTFLQFLEDHAAGVAYDDSLVAPTLPGNPTEVQAAIDALKALYPPSSASQIVYVNKGGNDLTADGSLTRPFLTIQAAINFITGASRAKRYNILVGPRNLRQRRTRHAHHPALDVPHRLGSADDAPQLRRRRLRRPLLEQLHERRYVGRSRRVLLDDPRRRAVELRLHDAPRRPWPLE